MTPIDREPEADVVAATPEVPPGFVRVPMGKGCVLLLTEAQHLQAIRWGKQWRRREQMQRRERGVS